MAAESYTYDPYGAGERPQTNHSGYNDLFSYDNASGQLTSAALGVTGGTAWHYYSYNRAGDRQTDSIPGNFVARGRNIDTRVDGAGRIVSMRFQPTWGNTMDTLHLWTYWYDALGRRIAVADSTPSLSGPLTRIFYDGDNMVLRGEDYWWQQGGVDGVPIRVHRNATEAFLNDLGVDRPLYSSTVLLGNGCNPAGNGTTEYFYHADERGNVRQVTFGGSGTYCQPGGYGYSGYGGGGTTPTNSRPGVSSPVK